MHEKPTHCRDVEELRRAVAEWLARQLGTECTTEEIAAGIGYQHAERSLQTRIGNVVTKLGWRKVRRPMPPRKWVYLRPMAEE
jgi:hypothetical protein